MTFADIALAIYPIILPFFFSFDAAMIAYSFSVYSVAALLNPYLLASLVSLSGVLSVAEVLIKLCVRAYSSYSCTIFLRFNPICIEFALLV